LKSYKLNVVGGNESKALFGCLGASGSSASSFSWSGLGAGFLPASFFGSATCLTSCFFSSIVICGTGNCFTHNLVTPQT
jgi:hypothetical protein